MLNVKNLVRNSILPAVLAGQAAVANDQPVLNMNDLQGIFGKSGTVDLCDSNNPDATFELVSQSNHQHHLGALAYDSEADMLSKFTDAVNVIAEHDSELAQSLLDKNDFSTMEWKARITNTAATVGFVNDILPVHQQIGTQSITEYCGKPVTSFIPPSEFTY